MLYKLKAAKRSLRADRSGATALEAAVVLPLVFTVALGLIEFGFLVYGYSAVNSAAAIVARNIAVNAVDISKAQAEFERIQPSWFSGAAVTAQLTNPGDSKLTAVKVHVSVAAGLVTPIKLVTGMYSWTLSGDSSVKKELPYNG